MSIVLLGIAFSYLSGWLKPGCFFMLIANIDLERMRIVLVKSERYNLVILGCCFALFFMMIGMVNAPAGLFIVPVSEQFGFSRSAFSVTLSLTTLISMLVNLYYGQIYRRLGLRKMIATGFISVVIGFLILSFAKILPVFYLGGILAGIGMGVGASTTIALLINSWFTKRQGLLLGFCSAGSGIGGWLFSRVFVNIITNHGYEKAYLLTAIALAVVAIPIIVLVKENPKSAIKPAAKDGRGYFADFKHLLTNKPGVRWTWISAFTFGLIAHAVLVATPGHLEVNGLNPIFAGTIYGAVYFALAGTKILTGWLNDRFGTRTATAACMISFVAGTILLIFTKTTAMAWIFVIVFSISVSSQAVLSPLLAKSVLSPKQYGRYLGMYTAAVTAGITTGVPLINFSYDSFGSYVPAMLLYIAIGCFSFFKLMKCLPQKQAALVQQPLMPKEEILPAAAIQQASNKGIA
jgi:MFS family permease